MGSYPPRIAILTCTNDLHALTIADRVERLFDARCDVIEVDTVATAGPGLSWSGTDGSLLPARDGNEVTVADIDAIWYRRVNMPQRDLGDIDTAYRGFIDQTCAATVQGIAATGFGGTWVSDPDASRNAENKIVQLNAAAAAGLSVPATLVSQSPDAVTRFHTAMAGQIVMKPLRFAPAKPLLTIRVEPEHLLDTEAIRLCPTIFQEYIPGTEHLRVLCFGDEIHAVSIDSPLLDWRPNTGGVECRPVELDAATTSRIRAMLAALNLRMGIFDFKLNRGRPIFLEVNPQGQFLFVEGLTGVDLATPFATFLYQEAARARDRQLR